MKGAKEALKTLSTKYTLVLITGRTEVGVSYEIYYRAFGKSRLSTGLIITWMAFLLRN